MTLHADPRRQAQARQVATELRALQDRLNLTIDQLCDLALGGALAASPAPQGEAGPGVPAHWLPDLLMQPAAEVAWSQPATGTVLGPQSRFYSNYKKGLLQIVQQPRPRSADCAYSLVVNYADIDGDWLSLVFDARALLQGAVAGRARLSLLAELRGQQFNTLFAKCAWKGAGGKWTERTVELRSQQSGTVVFDIDDFDPTQIQALDVHVMCNPGARGSIELRRLGLSLAVRPEGGAAADAADIFEAAP